MLSDAFEWAAVLLAFLIAFVNLFPVTVDRSGGGVAGAGSSVAPGLRALLFGYRSLLLMVAAFYALALWFELYSVSGQKGSIEQSHAIS